MSYTLSKTTRSVKFVQPVNIAVVASFGIHALVLGVALPSFSNFSPESNAIDSRNVNVVELSPLEQSRLPDLSNSLINLGAGSNIAGNSPAATTAENSPAFNLPFPNSALGSFPPSSPLPQMPLNSVSTPAYFPQLPSLPPPPPLTMSSAPPLPFNAQNIPFPSVRAPIYTQPEIRVSFPPSPPPISARDLINQKPFYSQDGSPLPPPGVMATKPSSSAESNIDKNQQALSTNKDIQRQRQQALMAALQKKAASLQNDRTNTTDEEARRNYVNWAVAVKTDKPETLNIAGIYPKDACPRRLSGNAVYGVLASTQGRATNVELIKSAGYPIFNQKAIEQINSFRFPNPTGNSKAYRVNVSFDYDSQTCPSYGNSSRIEATKSQPTPDNLPKNVNPATATPTTTKTPNNTPVETKRGSEPLAPPATRNAPSSAPPVEAKRELEPLAPPATRNAPSSAPPVEAKREPEPLAPPATRNAPSSIPPVEAKREPEPLAPNEPQASPNLPKPTAQKSTTEAESLAPEAPAKVQPGAEILPAAPPAPTKTDPAREQE